MKSLFSILIALLIMNLTQAQTKTDKELVESACWDYIEGFYQGDTSKIINSMSPTLHKFGYWKDDKTGKYKADGYMSFDQAKSFAKRVFEKKSFAKPNATKKVEVFDIMNHIASAKITAWWGVDYVLLSKAENKWIIEQVLWEGPLEKQ